MADETENQENETSDEVPAPPTSGGGRTLMLVFVSVVVLLETGMFFFLVPSADEVSALAEARLISSVQQKEVTNAERALDEDLVKEFNLGMYGETFSPNHTERVYRVELDLFGTCRQKNLTQMESEFSEKQGRLRHEIRMIIRNSDLSELEENNLGLLQRRILRTCNHLLEDALLLSIGFKSYELAEQ
ncbi:MAG: dihydrolipoamide acetyltransferase [Planctomycetota bacterium]|nr:dihydrolipoamide acetyltransferase [Planctomycetota bacterium]